MFARKRGNLGQNTNRNLHRELCDHIVHLMETEPENWLNTGYDNVVHTSGMRISAGEYSARMVEPEEMQLKYNAGTMVKFVDSLQKQKNEKLSGFLTDWLKGYKFTILPRRSEIDVHAFWVWTKQNIKGDFCVSDKKIWFRSGDDAMLYKLTWHGQDAE